jgi:hypothetical protein
MRERLAIEAELKAAAAARQYAADRPAREAAAQQAEHERRELKKRLLLHPEESADFTYRKYDGRFPDAASVEKAIRESWAVFLAGTHDLDSQAQGTITTFLQNHPSADITLPETFEAALAYLEKRLCPAEVVTPAVPVATPVTVDRYELVRTEIADLRAKAEKCAFGSKERNDLERRAMVLETQLEVLGDSEYQKIIQTIVDQSGKYLSSAHNLQFRQWLSARPQTRRFGVNPDAQNIRLAFAEWSGSSEWLDPQEQAEIQRRANIKDYSSSDIKQICGSVNTYDPNGTGHGYRAGRA